MRKSIRVVVSIAADILTPQAASNDDLFDSGFD
jgi:hypothetical protein